MAIWILVSVCVYARVDFCYYFDYCAHAISCYQLFLAHNTPIFEYKVKKPDRGRAGEMEKKLAHQNKIDNLEFRQ